MNRLTCRLLFVSTAAALGVLSGCETIAPSAMLFVPEASLPASMTVSVDNVQSLYVKAAAVDVSVGLKQSPLPVERELRVSVKNKSDKPLTVDQGSFRCAAIKASGERIDADLFEITERMVPPTTGHFIGTPGKPGSVCVAGNAGGVVIEIGGVAKQKSDVLPGRESKIVLALKHDKAGRFEKKGETEVWVGEQIVRYEASLSAGSELVTVSFRVEREADQDSRSASPTLSGLATEVTRVPRGTIRLDGSLADWERVPPVLKDDQGKAAEPAYADLKAVYLAADDRDIFLRFDLRRSAGYTDTVGYALSAATSPSVAIALEAYNTGLEWRARIVQHDPPGSASTRDGPRRKARLRGDRLGAICLARSRTLGGHPADGLDPPAATRRAHSRGPRGSRGCRPSPKRGGRPCG